MTLAIIKSAQENTQARSACGQSICWVGLVEDPGTEHWRWHDGTAVSYSNWHTGEPNNFGGRDEDRAIMNFDWGIWEQQAKAGAMAGTWYDARGSEKIPHPLCESSAGAFEKISENVDYRTATDRCVAKGMSLAIIKSTEENAKARSACGQSICWIGLVEDPGTEHWRWHDGTEVSYTNWQPGEPNNFGGHDERRAIMNFDFGIWAKQAATGWISARPIDQPKLVGEIITDAEIFQPQAQPQFSNTGSSTSGATSSATVIVVAVALTSLVCCILGCCMVKALCGCLCGGAEDVFDGDGKVGLTGQAEEMGVAGMAGHYLA